MDTVVLPSSQRAAYAPATGTTQIDFDLPASKMIGRSAFLCFKVTFAGAVSYLSPYAGAYALFREMRTQSEKTGVLDNVRIDQLAAAMHACTENAYDRLVGYSTVTEMATGGSYNIYGGLGAIDAAGPPAVAPSAHCALDLGKFLGLFADDIDLGKLGAVKLFLTLNSDRDAIAGEDDPAEGTYSLSNVELRFKAHSPDAKVSIPPAVSAFVTQAFTLRSNRALASMTLSRETFALLCSVGYYNQQDNVSNAAMTFPAGLSKIIMTHRGEQKPDYTLTYEAEAGDTNDGVGENLFQDLYLGFARAANVRCDEGSNVVPLALRQGEIAGLDVTPGVLGEVFGFGYVFDRPMGKAGDHVQIAIDSSIDNQAGNQRVLYVHRREIVPLG